MRRVHLHFPAVRVALEQCQLAWAEFVAVLLGIGGRDGEQRFVGGKGVLVATRRIQRIAPGEATIPGRDGAGGITRPLRTERGEVLAETRGLGGVHLGLQQRGSQHRDSQKAGIEAL
ncbi:hypothetical protein D9M71_360530 [compost metagenome]